MSNRKPYIEEVEDKYQEALGKVQETCDSEKLMIEWSNHHFPIIATIKEDDTDKDQVTMDMGEEEQKQLGQMRFVFDDELIIQVDDNFYISDDLLNKLKNQLKKLHYLYLQVYFKRKETRQ